MRTYIVGGAVRDRLLGLPVQDRDHVVVGASVEAMLALGYQPVGHDFPVFLHPETHEQYALARTERKSAPGYRGFVVHAAPEVTLEEDLARRDLTINAMAEDEQGSLIDPFGGQADLAAGCLRHVGPAFAEDPVRILRLARFAARFGFAVAEETLALCRRMVANGEVDHLVPERVWQEIAKGLMETRPSRMFIVLRHCGALARLMPALDALFGVPQPPQWHPEIDTGDHVMRVVDYAALQGWPLDTRFAALCHDLGKGLTPTERWPSHHNHEALGTPLVEALCQNLRVPAEVQALAVITCREHGHIHRARELRPVTVLEVFTRCDAWRKPERFARLLDACVADARGRTGLETVAYPQAAYLHSLLQAARAVDAGAVARQCADTGQVAEAIRLARLQAVQQAAALARQEGGNHVS